MTFDQLSDDRLQELRQQYEVFLDRLEALAVKAIASNNWDEVYHHISNFSGSPDRDEELVDPIAFLKLAQGEAHA